MPFPKVTSHKAKLLQMRYLYTHMDGSAEDSPLLCSVISQPAFEDASPYCLRQEFVPGRSLPYPCVIRVDWQQVTN
eukprot:1159142-Pelagomonas_calceolata.AAC.7